VVAAHYTSRNDPGIGKEKLDIEESESEKEAGMATGGVKKEKKALRSESPWTKVSDQNGPRVGKRLAV